MAYCMSSGDTPRRRAVDAAMSRVGRPPRPAGVSWAAALKASQTAVVSQDAKRWEESASPMCPEPKHTKCVSSTPLSSIAGDRVDRTLQFLFSVLVRWRIEGHSRSERRSEDLRAEGRIRS